MLHGHDFLSERAFCQTKITLRFLHLLGVTASLHLAHTGGRSVTPFAHRGHSIDATLSLLVSVQVFGRTQEYLVVVGGDTLRRGAYGKLYQKQSTVNTSIPRPFLLVLCVSYLLPSVLADKLTHYAVRT